MLDPTFQGPPRDAFVRGARLFDAGAFFEAHEAWEERWLVETDPALRRFFQGFIQIAAGFHKLLVMKNPESASRLFAKGLAKIEAGPDGIAGASLASFRDGVRGCARSLARGAAGVEPSAIPKLGE